MGAYFDYRTYDCATADDVRMRFNRDAEQDRWENGHSYSGGIGMASGVSVPTAYEVRGRAARVKADMEARAKAAPTSQYSWERERADDLAQEAGQFVLPDSDGIFPDKRSAEAFVAEVAEKWENAIAVRYKDGERVLWFVGAWCSS